MFKTFLVASVVIGVFYKFVVAVHYVTFGTLKVNKYYGTKSMTD